MGECFIYVKRNRQKKIQAHIEIRENKIILNLLKCNDSVLLKDTKLRPELMEKHTVFLET